MELESTSLTVPADAGISSDSDAARSGPILGQVAGSVPETTEGISEDVEILSASDQLAAAVRRLIQEELEHRPEITVPSPQHKGTMGLLLLIVNIILFYMCLPEDLRKKDFFDFVTKVATFVGGGLALANPAFFRKTMAEVGSRPDFVKLNLAALVLLTTVQFGVIPVRPEVDPPMSLVRIDDGPLRATGTRFFPVLKQWDHTVEIDPPDKMAAGLKSIQPRKFVVEWDELLYQALPGVSAPQWPLLLPVEFTFDNKEKYTVAIHRIARPFDSAFRYSSTDLTFPGHSDATLAIGVAADRYPMMLPFGEYTFTAAYKDTSGKLCTAKSDETRQNGAETVNVHDFEPNFQNFECK